MLTAATDWLCVSQCPTHSIRSALSATPYSSLVLPSLASLCCPLCESVHVAATHPILIRCCAWSDQERGWLVVLLVSHPRAAEERSRARVLGPDRGAHADAGHVRARQSEVSAARRRMALHITASISSSSSSSSSSRASSHMPFACHSATAACMCVHRPDNPTEWLANYLLQNNPKKR